MGEQTFKLTNIVRAEPDASIFGNPSNANNSPMTIKKMRSMASANFFRRVARPMSSARTFGP